VPASPVRGGAGSGPNQAVQNDGGRAALLMRRHPEGRKRARAVGHPFAPGFGVNGQISVLVGRRDLALLDLSITPNGTTKGGKPGLPALLCC